MPGELAIDLRHVAKTYKGRVHALRGVDMRIHKGEIFGLLGPNGAGKSTLVKILMTVIRPSKCEGTMLGHKVGHKPTLARVGYLPEHHRFPDYLTGAQVVDFYGAMCKVPRRERKAKTGKLLELVGMSEWAKKKLGGYSKGMRQRVGIAQALVNDPELVLLDEPTDGVDPVGRRDIRNILQQMKSDGRTVFLNSHLLSELEMVCDRVAILVQGTVRAQGTIDELTVDKRRYEIELAGLDPKGATERITRVIASLGLGSWDGQEPPAGWKGSSRLASGHAYRVEASTLHVQTAEPSEIQGLIDAFRRESLQIRAIRPFRPSLEDLFMEAVTDPTTGKTLLPGASRDLKGGRR
ncbi:MAG: ABC transporter ATP-binding protein [Phycisphaerales bacterium]